MRRLLSAFVLLLAASASAQTAPQAPAPLPPVPRLAPADSAALVTRLASPDSVIAILYRVISGPAGQRRDWDLFRRLFVAQGRLVPTGRDQQGNVRYRAMTPEDYVRLSGPVLEERGFFETETHRVAEQYGHVYHAFSSYESRATPEAAPFARGINSIQLLQMNGHWWVVSVFWGDEQSTRTPIPAKYGGTGQP